MDAEESKRAGSVRTAWFKQDQTGHPLLLAMPLPKGVDPHLARLQELVSQVIAPEATLDDCLNVIEELDEISDRYPVFDAQGWSLGLELCKLALKRLWSPRLCSWSISFRLRLSGLKVDPGFHGTPRSISDDTLNPDDLSRDAVYALGQVIHELEQLSVDEFRALGDEECKAAIRLVWLQAQCCSPGIRRERHRLRLEYLNKDGLDLWHTAISAMCPVTKRTNDFSECYGRKAFRDLRIKLRRAASTSGDPASDDYSFREIVAPGYHRVLLDEIPPCSEREHQETLVRYQQMSRPLPLTPLPTAEQLASSESRLLKEFPWAQEPVRGMFRELHARRFYGGQRLGFSPILLVGPPGLGKSRLVRRVAMELGVATLPLSCGSMSDSHAVNGLSRGWATGQPSPILRLMQSLQTPTLLIWADELDKGATSYGHAVSMHTSLLALLERETSRNWFEQYLQARCDMSSLLFIATANEIGELPAPLLSRFTVLRFARPERSDLLRAVPIVLDELAEEWNVPRENLPELTGADLQGSITNMREVYAAVKRAAEDLSRMPPRGGSAY